MERLEQNRPIDNTWVTSLDASMGNPPNQADHRMIVLVDASSEAEICDTSRDTFASPKFSYFILSGQHRWQVALRRINAHRLPQDYAWEAEIYMKSNYSSSLINYLNLIDLCRNDG